MSRHDESHAGKINAKDIEIFLNKLVHEFYCFKVLITLELEKQKNLRSAKMMVRLCKHSLYANESCDEHWVYFRQ